MVKPKVSNLGLNNIAEAFKLGDMKSLMSTPDHPYRFIDDQNEKGPIVNSLLGSMIIKKEHFGSF